MYNVFHKNCGPEGIFITLLLSKLQDKTRNPMVSWERPKQRKCSYQKLTLILFAFYVIIPYHSYLTIA